MWIEELQKDLNGRLLAIWTGKNEDGTPFQMEESKRLAYVNNLRRQAGLEPATTSAPRPGPCNCGRGGNG